MAEILDILQVGVGVTDPEKFADFTADLLGFAPHLSDDRRFGYVKADLYPHRIAIYSEDQPALKYIVLGVAGAQALADWQARLTARQVSWRPLSERECAERRVVDGIELKDPDDHVLNLAHGFEADGLGRPNGRDLRIVGLGHVLLTVADTQRSHDFYTAVLGFRLSDWVCIDEHIRLCFLRCNERHHSLAFAPRAPGKSPRLQHIMFEVESLDDVMRAYHFLRMRKAPIGMGPGRHPNCRTVHVYVQTPGGFAIELGWGHRRLTADHQPVVYPPGTPVDVWGGDIQSPDFELG